MEDREGTWLACVQGDCMWARRGSLYVTSQYTRKGQDRAGQDRTGRDAE